MKPTKFDLMRIGRYRAENLRVFVDLSAPLPVYVPPAPAAPFMEIDGVRYVEAPAHRLGMCDGCARFSSPDNCMVVNQIARDTFGRDCISGVIYIKTA